MVFASTTWLWTAATISLITWALHTFATRRTIVEPLLNADINRVSKFTNYYCWHMVTIVLLAMAASFAVAAQIPSAWELAAAATLLATAFAVWSLVLVFWKKQKPFELPQWVLFVPIAVTGLLGLL